MSHFPAFLDLRSRACLVVGTTDEARCKANALRGAGATVTVMDDIAALQAHTYVLAVIATGDLKRDSEAHERLSPWVSLINVVDRPSLCSFIWPAVIERGPVTIAVSTGGASPTLASLIRERIERVIPSAVGDLARLAGRLRRTVAAAVPTMAERRRFWRRALEGRAGALAFAGHSAAARVTLRAEAMRLLRENKADHTPFLGRTDES